MTTGMPTPDSVAPRSAPALLRDRTFGPWFTGNLLSNSGNWLYNVTAAVVVFNLTGSALLVGFVTAAQYAPLALLSPWAGALSDRFDRRRMLLAGLTFAATSATALAAVTLVIGVDGLPGVWPVIAASTGIGLGLAFAGPAMQSLVPALVPDRDLEAAVALTSVTFNLGRALGPALAGILLATAGAEVAFAANAASFVALIVAILVIHPRAVPRDPKADASVRAGLVYVRRNPVVIGMLIGAGAAGFATDPLNTLAPPLVTALGAADRFVAFLVSAFGAGAVITALVAGRLQRRFGLATVGRAGLLVLAAALVAAATADHTTIAAAAFAVAGCGFLLGLTSFTALLQRRVPEDLRGRVMALWTVAFPGTRPIAALVHGAAADAFGVRAAFGVAVTVAIAGAFVGARLAGRADPPA